MIKKLQSAVTERDEQITAFQKFSDALPQEAVALWTKEVEAWEKDPQQPNPFYIEQESMLYIFLDYDTKY